jgi:uncharacterized membrane protein
MTTTLISISTIGSAIVGGTFLVFSSFVMRALGRLPDAHGAAAMQMINITAISPVFMTAIFGTGAVCVAAMIASGDGLVIAGGLTYVIGVIGVTIAFNVPRNNALAAADAEAPETAELWQRYVREWTAWNHVRTVAGIVAAALLI